MGKYRFDLALAFQGHRIENTEFFLRRDHEELLEAKFGNGNDRLKRERGEERERGRYVIFADACQSLPNVFIMKTEVFHKNK